MLEEFGINAGYVEELRARYQENPQAVDPEWREVFERDARAEPSKSNGTAARAVVPADAPVLRATTEPVLGSRQETRPETLAPAAPGLSRSETLLATGVMQGRVYQLLNAYRVRGHLFAYIDPLGTPPDAPPELELENFGLSARDLDTVFPAV